MDHCLERAGNQKLLPDMEHVSIDSSSTLEKLTLDELCQLAHQCDLIDEVEQADGIVKLRFGRLRFEFREEEARLYLCGLIRGHWGMKDGCD